MKVFSKIVSMMAVSLTATTIFSGQPAFAQSEAALDAARRVNIAGRQRMLSQRISRFSCYIYAGIDAEEHMVLLHINKELFEASHNALRHGSADLALLPEENIEVRQDIGVVDKDWQRFIVHLEESFEMNTVDEENVYHIDRDGLLLLENGDKLVRRIGRVYGELLPDISLIMGLTIDIAGRQRMLTQKAAKEGCLIEAGVNVEENMVKLTETIRVFTVTMDALIDGYPGMVLPAPSEEIRADLTKARTLWIDAHAVFAMLANGQSITDDQRYLIDQGMEETFHILNNAVELYEHAVGLEVHDG